MKPETVSAVRDGLWLAVNGAGTAGRGRIAGRDVAGKTGTAQVISLQGRERARGKTDQDLRDHGWFVFMAPKDNPELAGVVFAEHAEHGYFGATVAKHIIETYFAQRDGLPLPALPVPPPAPVTPPVRRGRDRGSGGRHALMFERRLYYHIDWLLIGAVLAICAIGLAMIYSTTGGAGRVYWTQVYALGLGLIAMAVCLIFDYRSLADKSHWIYLAMMVAAGRRAVLRRGARRLAALDRSRRRSTCSRRSSPRPRWR